MTSRDEALRALEKKWRDAVAADRKKPMRMLENVWLCNGMESCADELAELLTTRQEVAPVACRGYAKLGIGAYLIEHSAESEPAALMLCVASDEEKAGRTVGDLKTFEGERQPIPAEKMVVRIDFANVAGLDALEQQLRILREVHFPASPAHTSEARDCPAQFFASGPQGDFFTADSKFANHLILVAGYDRDDWTVTDLYAAMRQEGGNG